MLEAQVFLLTRLHCDSRGQSTRLVKGCPRASPLPWSSAAEQGKAAQTSKDSFPFPSFPPTTHCAPCQGNKLLPLNNVEMENRVEHRRASQTLITWLIERALKTTAVVRISALVENEQLGKRKKGLMTQSRQRSTQAAHSPDEIRKEL